MRSWLWLECRVRDSTMESRDSRVVPHLDYPAGLIAEAPMTTTTSRTLVFAIFVAAVASGGALAGRTEQTAPAPEVLTALLTEVRGLRAALEEMASSGPRVQLTLGRLQLQE